MVKELGDIDSLKKLLGHTDDVISDCVIKITPLVMTPAVRVHGPVLEIYPIFRIHTYHSLLPP